MAKSTVTVELIPGPDLKEFMSWYQHEATKRPQAEPITKVVNDQRYVMFIDSANGVRWIADTPDHIADALALEWRQVFTLREERG